METSLHKSDFFSELQKHQKRNTFNTMKTIPKNLQELHTELQIAFYNLKQEKYLHTQKNIVFAK